ncbi:MAG: FG-GAP repeat protein, partial [Leptospiraceae bacterium]|nr:FG-GAP repeat protein [Leptospiraceae bacterium]
NQTSITNADGQPGHPDNDAASNSGAVYVFKRDSSGDWIQDAYLKASNAEGSDFFGRSVAISGSTIVVGADLEDSNQTTITNADGSASGVNGATDAGAVYVFKAF